MSVTQSPVTLPQVGQTNHERRAIREEKQMARLTLVPILQAEEDRRCTPNHLPCHPATKCMFAARRTAAHVSIAWLVIATSSQCCSYARLPERSRRLGKTVCCRRMMTTCLLRCCSW
jgi:hypothetical protein